MNIFFQQFIKNLKKPKVWLLIANVFLVFFLIILNNLNILPLRTGDFIFFAVLTLLLALWRPGWIFLFFIGFIPLENINLAPENIGINLRPYQFAGAILILSIIIRLLTKKLNFKLSKLNFTDYLVLILALAGFISAISSLANSLKIAVILASFVALYFLTRNYIQSIEDLKKVIPFFLSSTVVVALYGLWQNIRFMTEKNHFEIMPGRPNATFTEADWLGIFLTLALCITYALLHFFKKQSTDSKNSLWKNLKLYLLLILFFAVLILSVSRSAWLATLAATFFFLFAVFTQLKINPRNWQWKETFSLKISLLTALLISFAFVYFFHLTNFQLFNRVQSTASGLQKITISCEKNVALPEKIKNVTELEKYNCRHINLEEIKQEEKEGNYVSEIYRDDPNVNIRALTYQKTWQEIKKHPLAGVGWGNINKFLGQDERGANLNSSNIFLEVWLGSGILGLISFSLLWLFILFNAIKNYYFSELFSEKSFYLFLIISWFGLIIFNFFNAGILLGLLWVWLAISQIKNNLSN